ncbi:MAG: hypothetical protein FWD28_06955 [Treponema sp.]|nr:hypothetical protein [Treponema sp.]
MRKELGLYGIIVLTVIIGFTMVGCDGNPQAQASLNGTWLHACDTLVIIGSNFTILCHEINMIKGTLSYTGVTSGNVTVIVADVWDLPSTSWIPFPSSTNGTWSLSGNTLTLGGLGDPSFNGNWIKQ